jgi:hypothetical protein
MVGGGTQQLIELICIASSSSSSQGRRTKAGRTSHSYTCKRLIYAALQLLYPAGGVGMCRLLTEVKKLDDKLLLVDIHLLESRGGGRVKNTLQTA